MSPANLIPVFLLKTRSTPADNYAEHFSQPATDDSGGGGGGSSSATFSPVFVPVLKHSFQLGPIASWIAATRAGADTHGGLIFTSQRAVEAFARALALAAGEGGDGGGGGDGDDAPEASSSSAIAAVFPDLCIPLFVVGPATGRALAAVARTHLPRCPVLGAETGNGGELADFILHTYERQQQQSSVNDGGSGSSSVVGEEERTPPSWRRQRHPLLFFVGETRRDIIPRTLMSADLPEADRVVVDEQVVYETGVEEGFEAEFRAGLEARGEEPLVWVVVFSPTGCGAMLDVLGWKAGSGWNIAGSQAGRVRVATIGPTTRDHLKSRFGFDADVCAKKPSPEGVRKGIEQHMNDNPILWNV